MQCVVSVPDLDLLPRAISSGADVIEIRLDLTGYIGDHAARDLFSGIAVPLIFTIRSRAEGGSFEGGPDAWWETLLPCIPYATYVDVEQAFARIAPMVKETGRSVIASLHTPAMPGAGSLQVLEARLRSFGDVPKIVVAPGSGDDVLALLAFTRHAGKPVITSIMGERFRYARLILPLFGSSMIYCHCGAAASPGQYHVSEWRAFCTLVRPGQP